MTTPSPEAPSTPQAPQAPDRDTYFVLTQTQAEVKLRAERAEIDSGSRLTFFNEDRMVGCFVGFQSFYPTSPPQNPTKDSEEFTVFTNAAATVKVVAESAQFDQNNRVTFVVGGRLVAAFSGCQGFYPTAAMST